MSQGAGITAEGAENAEKRGCKLEVKRSTPFALGYSAMSKKLDNSLIWQ
jgi:hypothetical protein